MSRKEKEIAHNSFYETDEVLGFEPRTEELIEYKRLIGKPITEYYDQLINSLVITEQSQEGRQSIESLDHDLMDAVDQKSVNNQCNAHSSETIVCDDEPQAKKFVDNLEHMRNPHIRDCVSLGEKEGTIDDYTQYQERKDLESYKRFLNSSAYDDVKEDEGLSWSQLLSSDIKDCRTCQNMSCRVEQNEKPVDNCFGYINHGHEKKEEQGPIKKLQEKRK